MGTYYRSEVLSTLNNNNIKYNNIIGIITYSSTRMALSDRHHSASQIDFS